MQTLSAIISCLLLCLYQSAVPCYSIQALNHTGSLKPENLNVNATKTVSLTCSAICGSIKWHINGRVISAGSLVDGLYEVHRVSSRCSASIDPVGCPQCGCSNCNNLKWPTSQTYNSTLVIAANESVIVDCVSTQNYRHQRFSVLRKRYNLNVIKSTPAPAICTCDSQPSLPQAQSVQRAAMAAQSTDSSQEHGIKTCSQEISTSVLATTLVFATIIIFILVGFLCEQRCRRKSQSCSSSI